MNARIPYRAMPLVLLAVLATGDVLGLDPTIAAHDLGRWQPPAGRGQRESIVTDPVEEIGFDLIDDAFNANPASMAASLEVLNFLPIESVDPFSGVIVTGYGTPPGGGSSYRATIYVSDPALDARSLKVSLQGKGGGAVSPETQRAVEDAILTRAREIRIRDSKL